ncbi:MAG: ABC transporter ATP-binding protein [Bacillota bacterium]
MFHLKNVQFKNILYINELAIEAGKTTCIVGESGSGKTTLLKLLNHLINYEQGQIKYKEEDLKGLDAISLRREVILLPQTPVIFPGTLRDNLQVGLQFSKKEPAPDEKLLEEIHRLELYKQLDDQTDTFSGGEKQRLALVRVILMDPEVLLLDEPTSALDDNTVDKVMNRILDYVKSRQKTLIMVTHSKQLAKVTGEKIITLENGLVSGIEEVA